MVVEGLPPPGHEGTMQIIREWAHARGVREEQNRQLAVEVPHLPFVSMRYLMGAAAVEGARRAKAEVSAKAKVEERRCTRRANRRETQRATRAMRELCKEKPKSG